MHTHHDHDHNDREHNIRIAAFLNISFTVIEIIGGIWTNSLAILSDALHDFGDSVALITSLIAEKKAKKPADKKRTYGYQRLSLFSAVFSAIVLVAGSLFILAEAIPRLLHPEPTYAPGMIFLAFLGIGFNGLSILKLKRGKSQSEKVLTWHLIEDIVGWVVILIGSVIMHFWNIPIIDPIMTFGFSLFVLWGVVKNLKGTINIFMQGVPDHIFVDDVEKELSEIEGIIRIHDIHIWSLEGETNVFSGHFVVGEDILKHPDDIKKKIKEVLSKHYVKHSTIELESEYFCSGIECEI